MSWPCQYGNTSHASMYNLLCRLYNSHSYPIKQGYRSMECYVSTTFTTAKKSGQPCGLTFWNILFNMRCIPRCMDVCPMAKKGKKNKKQKKKDTPELLIPVTPVAVWLALAPALAIFVFWTQPGGPEPPPTPLLSYLHISNPLILKVVHYMLPGRLFFSSLFPLRNGTSCTSSFVWYPHHGSWNGHRASGCYCSLVWRHLDQPLCGIILDSTLPPTELERSSTSRFIWFSGVGILRPID